jgi:hypothetical protein
MTQALTPEPKPAEGDPLFNITGIKPAYRRLIMDMSITLGQVLDVTNAIPGGMHVVNIRGQAVSAYAPAQVQDFLDWLLAVSPEWSVQTTPPDAIETREVTVEKFDVYKFQSVYAESSFVKYLANLLHQGTITMLMSAPKLEDGTHVLCIEIQDRHHEKIVEFTSCTMMSDIAVYRIADDTLVELGDAGQALVQPYQVAAVTSRNARSMGHPRYLRDIRVVCGPLVGRNGATENAMPCLQAISVLETTILNNLVEYGFKLTAQLRLLKTIRDNILNVLVDVSAQGIINLEESFEITTSFTFMDDDRAGVFRAPWCNMATSVKPLKSPSQRLDAINESYDGDAALLDR